MAIYDDTVGLESFLQKALHISQHLTACHTEESFTTAASPATHPPAPEPMQTDRYHLTPTERARRVNLGLCMYCGAHDHLLPVCLIHPTRPAVSTVQILPDVSKLSHIDALLIHMNESFPAKVLVDSGASGNFISSLFLIQINVPHHRNATHYQITNIQGKPLGKGLVRSRTPEVTLHIGSLHSEYISFLVLEDATVDIVLGLPWLALHHPDIHWHSGEVLKWNDYCLKECLTNLPVPPQADTSASVCSTSIASVTSLYVTLSCCLSIFLFLVFFSRFAFSFSWTPSRFSFLSLLLSLSQVECGLVVSLVNHSERVDWV